MIKYLEIMFKFDHNYKNVIKKYTSGFIIDLDYVIF